MGVRSAAEVQTQQLDDRQGPSKQERLGGARADFVANLGKRRAEIRATLDILREDPEAKKHIGDLRRRVHALGAGAKLLRFTRLADELKTAETQLDEAAERGSLADQDFGTIHDLVGRMTSLAWAQTTEPDPVRPFAKNPKEPARTREAEEADEELAARGPMSVLVVGASHLADALTPSSRRSDDEDGYTFDVERAEEMAVAVDLARALAPDVMVIDGDIAGARATVETLVSDPLTETIPIVVLLKVLKTDDAGPYLALGVARTLPKPVSPSELRRACAGVMSTYVRREVAREPLGELNLDQLGNRLAEELRRGLCDTASTSTRESTVKLGEGTEVLAALWGAVARIRDVVTIRSQGGIRFSYGGPEGAVPIAPWLDTQDGKSVTGGSRNGAARSGRAATDVSLKSLRVLVADDDAAVAWFLAGVFKTAGAEVYEARDGERALEVAKHCDPDLVISDILMPKLDGFALCRALKRDVILRDVPLILLSWKEDLLQRVRELGADADGYLRKEASAGVIVQRVKELVRLRQRVGQRISSQSEMRGRLDGLTTFTLLKLVCQKRPNSTLTVRDASYLYEVEVRGGRPARATRTAMTGAFERGPSVLAALLGVGDGRFVVTAPKDPSALGSVRHDLDGSLTDQLTPVIATARAASRLLTGPSLLNVSRVELDEELLDAYWGATPEPARSLVRSIAQGTSPRDLITSGRAPSRLLEDVLVDAAIHGAVIQVFDAENEDRMPEATTIELALLRGERAAKPITTLPLLTSTMLTPMPAPPVEVTMPMHAELMKSALVPNAPMGVTAAPPMVDASGPALPFATAQQRWTDHPSHVAELSGETDALDDGWFTAGHGASEGPAADVDAADSPPPPSAPRLLSLTPPPAPVPTPAPPREKTPTPVVMQAPTPTPTPTPSSLPPPPGLKPMLSLGSLHPPPVDVETPKPKNTKKSPKPAPVADARDESNERRRYTPRSPDVEHRFPLPSAYMPHPPAPKKDRKALYWVGLALLGVAFALWARWSREKSHTSETAMLEAAAPPAAVIPAAPGAPVDGATVTDLADTNEGTDVKKEEDVAPEDLPLRESDKVKKGQGLVEIVAGKSDTIYVDGKAVGSGPLVSVALKARPEPYEVKVKLRGEERSRFVTVKEGRLARLRISPPWTR